MSHWLMLDKNSFLAVCTFPYLIQKVHLNQINAAIQTELNDRSTHRCQLGVHLFMLI